jgi:branched-chain amino acid transport system permease protein
VSRPRISQRLGFVRDLPLIGGLGVALLTAGAVFMLSFLVSPYQETQLVRVVCYGVALMGMVILMGDNGQVSLGQGAFMAVGAYSLALLRSHTGLLLGIDILIVAAISTAAGVLVGLPASRLRGPYLAGMTLALATALPLLAIRYASVFGGEEGISVSPPIPPGSIDPERWLAWIAAIVAATVAFAAYNLRRSKWGRALRAVRDDEVAASLAGISVTGAQVLAFGASAAAAGVAGALLALVSGIVNPGEFPVALSILLLAGIVIGGTSSLAGAWWGALIVTYLPSWANSLASFFGLSVQQRANFALLLNGVLLIAAILLAPGGIQGYLVQLASLIRKSLVGRAKLR